MLHIPWKWYCKNEQNLWPILTHKLWLLNYVVFISIPVNMPGVFLVFRGGISWIFPTNQIEHICVSVCMLYGVYQMETASTLPKVLKSPFSTASTWLMFLSQTLCVRAGDVWVLNTLSRSSRHHSRRSSCRLFTPCCGWVSDLPKSVHDATSEQRSEENWDKPPRAADLLGVRVKTETVHFRERYRAPFSTLTARLARNGARLNGPPVSLAGPLSVKWICNSTFSKDGSIFLSFDVFFFHSLALCVLWGFLWYADISHCSRSVAKHARFVMKYLCWDFFF